MSRFRYVSTVVCLHIAGAVAGYGASLIDIPLAWLIGSMLLTATVTVTMNVAAPPRWTRLGGQLIVGAAIGLYLTPAAVERILANVGPIVLSAVLVTGAAVLIGIAQARFTGMDKATAIFSSVPGGPMEMANLAAENGGDPMRAAFAQMSRVLAIVLLYPPLLLAGGAEMTFAPVDPGEIDAVGIAMLLAVGLAGSYAAYFVGLSNPFFLGPMLFVGLLVGAAGVSLPSFPEIAIALAQILIGVSLGSMFRRELLSSGWRFILQALCSTAVLLLASMGVAQLCAVAFGLHFPTMMLANAPGAITEMSIIAKAMHLDVSLIVAFQVVRVFLSMSLTPILYSRVLVRL